MITTRLDASLNHQLRLCLFEKGLSLSVMQLDFFISKARRETLRKLTFAAEVEGLMDHQYQTACPLAYLNHMKSVMLGRQQAARFWAWSQLSQEIETSTLNLSLALVYRYIWNEQLKKTKSKTLWEWSLEALSQHERTLFFEQWGSEGHPYHPNSNAKMGFSLRDTIQYAPEFQAQFEIEWLAIDKRFAKASVLDFERFTNLRFPKEMAFWREALRKREKIPAHFYAIPVHPWQLTHTLPKLYQEQLDEELILPLDVKQKVTPTMSFRTVVSENPSAPHVKLATAVHTTSAMRTVSPASVHNGPKLSHLLKMILSHHNHFNQTLYMMDDLGGVYADHSEGKHLSALFRENTLERLDKNESAVVLCSLFSRSPLTQQPLFIEIMMSSGLPPKAYFERYCDVLLPGQMTLYLKYGLSLESHQQNSFMVFDNNHLPIKMLNRDLGGIRVKPSLLKRHGYLLALESNPIDTEDDNEIRNKFIHANLESHLSYIIQVMVNHFADLECEQLWVIVKRKMLMIIDSLQSDIGKKRYEMEKKMLFTMPWQFKSLLRMRLEPNQTHYLYRPKLNPLAKED